MNQYRDVAALETRAQDDYEEQRYWDAILAHSQALTIAG